MSGGKGGSKSTSTEIPAWIEEPATRNLARAEQAQQLGYMPYYGIDVAGFNPTQQAAMQMNLDAANAFGMMPSAYSPIGATPLTPLAGMPATQTIGGITGYTSSPLYEQAVSAAQKADPRTAAIYGSLFGQDTGYTPKV